MAALRETDGFVSGQQLALALAISRAAVWKHVEALRNNGHLIESVRSRGHRLVAERDVLDAARFALEPGAIIGSNLVIHDRTASTNSDAAALGRSGSPEGTVVLAEEQTAGRGRLGRAWESRRGLNLYLSMLLRPAIGPAMAPQLALVAGVAVAMAFEKAGLPVRIKWPNDVVTPEFRKVAGILAEIQAEADRVDFVVVGIGINLNAAESDFPLELRRRASSLAIETGSRVDRVAFASSLFREFEQLYAVFCQQGFGALAETWQRRSILQDRSVVASGTAGRVEGQCVGLDEDGALLLQTATGLQRVVAGDVTIEGGYDQ